MVHEVIRPLPVASSPDVARVSRCRYEAMVRADEASGSARWRNLGELANLARGVHASELDAFLDQIALVSDVDALDGHGRKPKAASAVQLSTVHGAKGLEFDVVFAVGVEEGLMPHYHSEEEAEVEEERRLLYVAMTRARHRLYLTHAESRSRWGRTYYYGPSRFLDDLPPDVARLTLERKRRRRPQPRY